MKWNNKFNYPKSSRSIEEGYRKYLFGDEKLPSVTTILSATKSEEEKAALANWKERVGHKEANRIKTEASSRGTSMHSYIEDYLRGRVNESFFESNEQYKNMAKEIIEKGDKLKIIARCGVGVDNIDLEYAKSKNIKVTNSPSANLTSVVELAVALIINASRKIILSDMHLKDGKWDRKEFIGMELSGKQLGIVGYGKAGRLVSERMKSFGMSIAFYDPYVKDWDGPEKSLELDELLSTSDVFSIPI